MRDSISHDSWGAIPWGSASFGGGGGEGEEDGDDDWDWWSVSVSLSVSLVLAGEEGVGAVVGWSISMGSGCTSCDGSLLGCVEEEEVVVVVLGGSG